MVLGIHGKEKQHMVLGIYEKEKKHIISNKWMNLFNGGDIFSISFSKFMKIEKYKMHLQNI